MRSISRYSTTSRFFCLPYFWQPHVVIRSSEQEGIATPPPSSFSEIHKLPL
jgi:hypothetical protein